MVFQLHLNLAAANASFGSSVYKSTKFSVSELDRNFT